VNRFLLLAIALTACGTSDKPRSPMPDSIETEDFDSLAPAAESVEVKEASPIGAARAGVLAGAILGDTSQYLVSYALDRPPRTVANGGPDTVRVALRRDSTAGVLPLSFPYKFRFTQRDTASFKVPKVYGLPAKYTATVLVRKNGVTVSPGQSRSWTTNLPAKVDTTPPKVDSMKVDSVMAVIVKPDSFAVTRAAWEKVGVYFRDTTKPGGRLLGRDTQPLAWTCPSGGAGKCPTQQFCAYFRLFDGSVAIAANSAGINYCDLTYLTLPGHRASLPIAHPSEQLKIAIATGPDGTARVQSVQIGSKELAPIGKGEWIDPSLAPVTYVREEL